MRVNNNIGAINAHRNLYRVDTNLGKSLEKLSSGLRINRASDDAAGLGISESLRAQIRGLSMAERNAQDGLGYMQTADAALQNVSDMLQRMRELAVQSANGTMTATQRTANDLEQSQLAAEIDRIGTSTQFNGTNVFSATALVVQVGANNVAAADRMTITLQAMTAAAVPGLDAAAATDAENVSAATINLTTQAGAQTAIGGIDLAISNFNNFRAQVGAYMNRLEYTISTIQNTRENIMAAESRIRDTDMASEMTQMTKNQILVQSATAMIAQANARPQSVLALLQ
jgi:flagellin